MPPACRPSRPRHRFSRRPARALAGCLLAALPILSAALPFACRSASAGDADAIRALVRREVEAINKKDLKALSEIWSQDKGILLFDVPPPGRFQGWGEIGHLFKDFFDRFSEIRLGIDRLEVDADGTIGYATYDWTMTGRMGDYAVDDRGQATAIYRREKEGWRLVHAHYSPAPPALAGEAARSAGAGPGAGVGAAGAAAGAAPGAGASPAPH